MNMGIFFAEGTCSHAFSGVEHESFQHLIQRSRAVPTLFHVLRYINNMKFHPLVTCGRVQQAGFNKPFILEDEARGVARVSEPKTVARCIDDAHKMLPVRMFCRTFGWKAKVIWDSWPTFIYTNKWDLFCSILHTTLRL